MRIFEFANTKNLEKVKVCLVEMHDCPNDFFVIDNLDLEKTKRDTIIVEVFIRHVND